MNHQVATRAVQWLGQATPAEDSKAWETYLVSLRASILDSWRRATSAYNGLRNAREQLGLPFMVPAGSGESVAPGLSSASAWDQGLEQQAGNLMAMVQLITNSIDDVVANKRKLEWDQARREFFVELLPTDLLRIDMQGNVPVLVNAKTGAPENVVPNNGIASLGIPPIVWFATATTSVFALPVYFVVQKAVDNMRDVAEQKTIRTIGEKSYECVQSGKCTPDEAAKLNQSLYSGAAGIHESKAKEESAKAKPTQAVSAAVIVAAIAAVGLAAILVFGRRTGGGASAAAQLPAASPVPALARNPRREPADETAADELKLYIDNEDRFAMLGHGLGRAISQNLWKKWQKGTYDPARAPQAWSYVVESAAHAYAKEFDSERNWSRMFNPATRDLVAVELAREWENYARSGEFDRFSPAGKQAGFGFLPLKEN